MNKRLKKLLNRKAAIAQELSAMLSLADKEERDLTEAEQLAYAKLEEELGAPTNDGKAATGLFADIEREERLAKIEKSLIGNIDPKDLASGNGQPKPIRIEGLNATSKYFKTAEDAYSVGRFLRALSPSGAEDLAWCREHGVMLLSTVTDNGTAAILLPDVLTKVLINLKEKYGVFRANAQQVEMLGETQTTPRRRSGVQVYYGAQGTTVTPSPLPATDGVQLVARDLYGYLKYPKLLATGAIIQYADFVASEIAYAFSKAEDLAGFIGDGSSTYGGILGAAVKLALAKYAGSLVTAADGNTAVETLDLADFQACVAKLPSYAKDNAKWYVHPTVKEQSINRLKYGMPGNTVADLNGKPVEMFLGYPVVDTLPLNSTLGVDVSKVKVLFGDLEMAAQIGDRQKYAIATDESVHFLTQEIAVLGTQRYDINVHDLGTDTVPGSLVALRTAAEQAALA